MDYPAFLKAINQKNAKAWEKLYHNYYASLCSYAGKIVGEAGIPEDIVQDCLIRLWRGKVEFSEMRALTAWLYKSVYHASISVLREKQAQQRLQKEWQTEPFTDEEQMVKMALKEEVISRFYEVLHQMPLQQQEILLHSLKGLKVQEIAEVMNISENTVKTQKKRAYLFVREQLGDRVLQVLFILFSLQ